MKLENGEKNNRFFWNCNLVHEIGALMPKTTHSIHLSIVPIQIGLLVRVIIGFNSIF